MIADVYYVHNVGTKVVLSTAKVGILGDHGEERTSRILLDPGSQANLITSKVARQMKLSYSNDSRPISGINRILTTLSKVTYISSLCSNFTTVIECLVVSEITEQLHQTTIDVTKIHIPKDVKLTDPTYHKPGPIEMLIGAGVYRKILIGESNGICYPR